MWLFQGLGTLEMIIISYAEYKLWLTGVLEIETSNRNCIWDNNSAVGVQNFSKSYHSFQRQTMAQRWQLQKRKFHLRNHQKSIQGGNCQNPNVFSKFKSKLQSHLTISKNRERENLERGVQKRTMKNNKCVSVQRLYLVLLQQNSTIVSLEIVAK